MTDALIIDAVRRPRGLGRGVNVAIFDLQRDKGEDVRLDGAIRMAAR